jgi:hypothetical protein
MTRHAGSRRWWIGAWLIEVEKDYVRFASNRASLFTQGYEHHDEKKQN